jgi:pantetheine-phosphate adenylyltransferase
MAENSGQTAIVTGSFDPVTVGHADIIRRASALFYKVYAVLLVNPDKEVMFKEKDRLIMLERACAAYPNVETLSYGGLAIDIAKKLGASYIVRGVRDSADLAYEVEMRDWNFLHGGIETLFLPASEELREASSTIAKAAVCRGDFSLIPPEARDYIKILTACGER